MTASSNHSDLFGKLERQSPDALLAVIGMHRADPRPHKIDVGVGVYRDEAGATPVMRAVKTAEARLLANQVSKSYLGAEGDQLFTNILARVSLGDEVPWSRITGIQTPGGTGALRLAAELIARSGRDPSIWIGTPSWPNHGPIFLEAGLTVRNHVYYDAERADIDFDAFVAALANAAAGDVVLLHGCCHNPTGTAFSPDQWAALTSIMIERGLVPLIDLAYQGLGQGLDEDASGTRTMLRAVPEAMVAYSCDKNFALYRERVGALWVMATTPGAVVPIRENLLALARSLWSMPPDHGAAVVRLILEDANLIADWKSELAAMCARINALRAIISAAHPVLAPIKSQQGLFALLPLASGAAAALRSEQGIYLPDSGRINVAGLSHSTIKGFMAALAPHLAH